MITLLISLVLLAIVGCSGHGIIYEIEGDDKPDNTVYTTERTELGTPFKNAVDDMVDALESMNDENDDRYEGGNGE